MSEADQAFHDSQKPSWGPDGTLIYAKTSKDGLLRNEKSSGTSDAVLQQQGLFVSEGKDICFAKFATTSDVSRHLVVKIENG